MACNVEVANNMNTGDQDDSISLTPSTSTPLRISSGVTPESGELEYLARKQETTKLVLADEMRGATFQGGTFALPVGTKKKITKIVKNLDNTGHSFKTYQPGKENLPPPKSKENKYYLHIITLLNAILEECRKVIPQDKSYFWNLVFHVYDRLTEEGFDGSYPLKPDAIGTFLRKLLEGQRVSWRVIEIPVEFKNDWLDMIAQAGSYGRCVFAAHGNRRFTISINYHVGQNTFRIGRFHRSGAFFEDSLDLGTKDGFEGVVRFLFWLLSLEDAAEAGQDPSHSATHFDIPVFGLYKIKMMLCNRICIRGRATSVFLIHKDSPGPPSSSHDPVVPAELKGTFTDETGLRRSKRIKLNPRVVPKAVERLFSIAVERLPNIASRRKKVRGSIQRSGDVGLVLGQGSKKSKRGPMEWSLIPPPHENPDLPQTDSMPKHAQAKTPNELTNMPPPYELIVKDSWLSETQPNEGQVFGSVRGQFGVVEVICSYPVEYKPGKPEKTESMGSSDLEYWDVFEHGYIGPPRETEKRSHIRTIYKTIGKPLKESSGPAQLLEGIVHAILGHWNLYKAGWLHRDVSTGNVLLTRDTRTLPPVTDFLASSDISQCNGIITDGDNAMEWKNMDREPANSRSGTLPFISTRLLSSWGTPDLHTAVDDLESFYWLLLWVILITIRSRGQLFGEENHWLSVLNISDVEYLSLAKKSMITELGIPLEISAGRTSKVLALFKPVLIPWGKLCVQGTAQVQNLVSTAVTVEDIMNFSKSYYEQYISIGLSAIRNLPTSWDDIF